MSERSQEEIVKNIVEVLETYVAPAVAGHGGEVNFSNYHDGVVILEMSGACSGCAGSTMTLKMGVEGILIEMVPEVQRVEGFDDPFSQVDPFYADPFMFHNYGMEDIEDSDIDPNN